MGEIVSLSTKRPHVTGEARCMDCGNKWQAIAPLHTDWLECPECQLVKGRFIYSYQKGDMEYQCKSGNDLFHITPDGPYCPNCGAWCDC